MGHTIKKLRVNKISILTEALPANQLPLTILKSSENAGITTALDNFLEDEFEIEKAVDQDKFLAALELLKPYRSDMPDDVQRSIDQLATYAAQAFSNANNMEKEEEIPANSLEAFAVPVPSYLLKSEEEEDAEEDDELDADPVVGALRRIEKKLDGKEEEIDLFPSVPLPTFAKIKKSESQPAVIKRDENEREVARKTSIDGLGDDYGNLDLKKEEEIVDEWPSVFDASVYRNQ